MFYNRKSEALIHELQRLPNILCEALRNRISFQSRMNLCYLVGLAFFGTVILQLVPLKDSSRLSIVDALFFAVAAVTGSSLATVRISEFNTAQNVTLLFLMLLGGRIFILFLQLVWTRLSMEKRGGEALTCPVVNEPLSFHGKIKEMHLVRIEEENESHLSNPLDPPVKTVRSLDHPFKSAKLNSTVFPLLERMNLPLSRAYRSDGDVLTWIRQQRQIGAKDGYSLLPFQDVAKPRKEEKVSVDQFNLLECQVFKYLSWVVLGYLVAVQFVGILAAIIYLRRNPDSQNTLRERHIDTTFFSVFTTISSFANCGYVPLNEGMVPFERNTTLLWIFVFQMALGNTMFSPCFRALLWAINTFFHTDGALDYLLKNPQKFMGELFYFKQTIWIATVELGFIALQLGCLSGLQWNTKVLGGLTGSQKFATAVYQTVSTRSTGINAVNMVDLSPTIIFIYTVMMYIPSEPVYLATKKLNKMLSPGRKAEDARMCPPDHEFDSQADDNKLFTQFRKLFVRHTALVILTTLAICMVENKRVVRDPLNFSILNIVFEVVSAFGNVGLSVGYSCSLNLSGEACQDVPYSLSGKWTPTSKLLLLPLMFAGRFR
eukprot:Gb_21018 [translate_table: standard]